MIPDPQHPMMTKAHFTCMQVCVPADWPFEAIERFAERVNPSGTEKGWTVREDEQLLVGFPVRNPCRDKGRPGFVHVMLDA